MKGPSGTVRVRDRLKALPPVYWPLRWARMALGEMLPPKQLPGVPGRVHANDTMIPRRSAEHAPGYSGSGKQIARLIGAHLPGPQGTSGLQGLDLGCGHGRVLRHLVTDFPGMQWTAADIDRSAVRFCQREFGVTGVVSSPRFSEVHLPGCPYDVVWMGSLVTHLAAAAEEDLWALLRRSMRPGALLALSAMGPACLDRLDVMMPSGSAQRARLELEMAETGRAYVNYRHYRSPYGLTFHTKEALESRVRDTFGPGTDVLTFEDRAWLEFQDLYVFRVGSTGPD